MLMEFTQRIAKVYQSPTRISPTGKAHIRLQLDSSHAEPKPNLDIRNLCPV